MKRTILTLAVALFGGAAGNYLADGLRPVAAAPAEKAAGSALDLPAPLAPAQRKADRPCYFLTQSGGRGGLWVQRDGGPGAMLCADEYDGRKSAFFALEADGLCHVGYQFAISADADGVCRFQIRDKGGAFHHIPVEALLKLKDAK